MKDIVKYAIGHNNTKIEVLSTSDVVVGILNDMQEKLDFSGDELQRMEFESGNSLSPAQNEQIATYSNLSKRIKLTLNKK